jgi:hypothetical protein
MWGKNSMRHMNKGEMEKDQVWGLEGYPSLLYDFAYASDRSNSRLRMRGDPMHPSGETFHFCPVTLRRRCFDTNVHSKYTSYEKQLFQPTTYGVVILQ